TIRTRSPQRWSGSSPTGSSPNGSAPARTRARNAGGRRPRNGRAGSRPSYTDPMRAERAKQLLKNGVYRSLGEITSGLGVADGDADSTLRVLMYHKINDVAENPLSVPVGLFDEQMGLLRDLGYAVVDLEQVL